VTSYEDQNLRIREDAIRIQEKDLEDIIKSYELENSKTSVGLAFAGLLLIQSTQFVFERPPWYSVLFLALLVLAVFVGFRNLFAKKVPLHTNVDEVFIRKAQMEAVKIGKADCIVAGF